MQAARQVPAASAARAAPARCPVARHARCRSSAPSKSTPRRRIGGSLARRAPPAAGKVRRARPSAQGPRLRLQYIGHELARGSSRCSCCVAWRVTATQRRRPRAGAASARAACGVTRRTDSRTQSRSHPLRPRARRRRAAGCRHAADLDPHRLAAYARAPRAACCARSSSGSRRAHQGAADQRQIVSSRARAALRPLHRQCRFRQRAARPAAAARRAAPAARGTTCKVSRSRQLTPTSIVGLGLSTQPRDQFVRALDVCLIKASSSTNKPQRSALGDERLQLRRRASMRRMSSTPPAPATRASATW